MTRFTKSAQRAIATLALSLTAATAHADLTARDAAQVEKLRGTAVISSDGALVGLIEGASISGDRASLFLKPGSGDILRRSGKDIIIRTNTTELTLQGTQIILNANAQRVRTKAKVIKDNDDQITVNLPRI
ncbi:hypothetical protein [Tateyamaria sp. ANG-S1]|uniref:hypothetical protein n=1 Tax=Tateyamaria sp. ANG-S1 TaxID=1577905 RepID=UPI00057F8E32|nr:hypothetical protein [Tateyamaria sp. ANG-S1]KIC48553.1 hypothetical protein RA29_12520 [Tateyamaria sp. ANG-S1]